nr:MAG TPA: hypothetical protein [Caudoviricetes sp.]
MRKQKKVMRYSYGQILSECKWVFSREIPKYDIDISLFICYNVIYGKPSTTIPLRGSRGKYLEKSTSYFI